MTDDERQVLVNVCEALRSVIQYQEDANRSWRALYAVLKQEFPAVNWDKAVADHRTGVPSASALSQRLWLIDERLQAVIESLKRPPKG